MMLNAYFLTSGYPDPNFINLDVDTTSSSFVATFVPPAYDPVTGSNLGYIIEYREEPETTWTSVQTAPNGIEMYSSAGGFSIETLIYVRVVPYVESGGSTYEGTPGPEIGPFNITGNTKKISTDSNPTKRGKGIELNMDTILKDESALN